MAEQLPAAPIRLSRTDLTALPYARLHTGTVQGPIHSEAVSPHRQRALPQPLSGGCAKAGAALLCTAGVRWRVLMCSRRAHVCTCACVCMRARTHTHRHNAPNTRLLALRPVTACAPVLKVAVLHPGMKLMHLIFVPIPRPLTAHIHGDLCHDLSLHTYMGTSATTSHCTHTWGPRWCVLKRRPHSNTHEHHAHGANLAQALTAPTPPRPTAFQAHPRLHAHAYTEQHTALHPTPCMRPQALPSRARARAG